MIIVNVLSVLSNVSNRGGAQRYGVGNSFYDPFLKNGDETGHQENA